jgi:ABC-type polysaccharide/polyol phosphate transport system ATPase subunit
MNAIAVQNLGKKFKLFTSPGGRFLEYMSIGKVKRHEDFWALKDISFTIPSGTTLGILGQNGSGKSTLLSILAGVLYPSEGSFKINGKVSAILELGSGFHMEFSGRDNVYMYGSIMGLTKPEIDSRFDEIVQFSELGDFIDQPLRTYSSGMIVRLAFSVAVNVDADILIVDEALAVGDAIFQHRCFRKIREMQAEGKTILYVGHDTEAVRNLCTEALLFDGGRIIERGDPNYVVNKYYALIAERERAYKEGNLIEHGEIPNKGFETTYNFVQSLKTAIIVCPPTIPIHEQTIEVNSTQRKVIFAHAPSSITYSVTIEQGSSLSFAIGIMPGAWEKIPQGVKFDIDVICDGNAVNIFSRVLQPKRNIGDRGWHNFIITLEQFSGKLVSIIFSTSGSGDDLSYGWSAWGWGKIIREINKPQVTNAVQQLKNEKNEENSFFRTNIRYGNKKAEIIRSDLLNCNNVPTQQFMSGETAVIEIVLRLNQEIHNCITVGCNLKNKYMTIYGINTRWEGCDITPPQCGEEVVVNISIPLNLNHGLYSLTIAAAILHAGDELEYLDWQEDCIYFRVVQPHKMDGVVDLKGSIKVLDL